MIDKRQTATTPKRTTRRYAKLDSLIIPDAQHQPAAYTDDRKAKTAQQMNVNRCLGFQTQTFRGVAGA